MRKLLKVKQEEKMVDYRTVTTFPEERYKNIPKENLIVFSIYSVNQNDELCSFDRLVRECFLLFPKAFGFLRYPEWPDSLKLDRPLRTLRGRGWVVGNAKTLFSLTKFGESVAKETEQSLKGSPRTRSTRQKTQRGTDTALINSLKESDVFKRYMQDKKGFSMTQMELRRLLQCTLETPLRVVKQNLQYSKNLAQEYNEGELANFLEACNRDLTKREV